jgi:hypothetical protein
MTMYVFRKHEQREHLSLCNADMDTNMNMNVNMKVNMEAEHNDYLVAALPLASIRHLLVLLPSQGNHPSSLPMT